ncbi:isocitrate lyase/PEP mutase family protein [Microlunatus soli]|uniref:2-Methylisocitrate lyase, PEP mutase family n=1 Tax=Microlunatus soli TaxID=630515 RepID=A0A1H1Q547_9ACTN|nr:isocitrate lyase/phosphoenolpyruvate mutase family protein [Microlunatus soli]SDS18628.1 2-Methylisocitrate lyase, PEP mutase family [Microlunatus soli]
MPTADQTSIADTVQDKAARLLSLHRRPEILTLINCWDVISARTAAGLTGAQAIATASHAIAASYGYQDGEQISRDEMLAVVARITRSVELPVTADLEAGYGDVGETIRRAIGVGVVGANLEDHLRPIEESVAMVETALAAGAAEGVPIVINARTDAFLLAPERAADQSLADAIERGRAYQQAGAQCVFVPGVLSTELIGELVGALGRQQVSIMNAPGGPTTAELAELGVARVSIGPFGQALATARYAEIGSRLLAGGGLPAA